MNSVCGVHISLATGDFFANVEILQSTTLGETFIGENNSNIFIGGAGADSFDGGLGVDSNWYLTSPTGVTINLSLQRASCCQPLAMMLLNGIASLPTSASP